MRIDPVSLRLFIAVAEEGSIAAASERQNIAPAAVSRRIAELEQMMECSLLTRHARGVEPTPAGKALRDLARNALNVLDDLPLQLKDYASGVSGQVRIFANISSITEFLPRDLASFTRKFPRVRIVLEESNSSDTIRAVEQNMADIGVYTAFEHGSSIQLLPYRFDKLCLLIPRNHILKHRQSVAFAELVDEPFVGLRRGSAINVLLAAQAARMARSLHFSIHVTGFDALCLMVEQGLGIGIAPEGIIRLYAPALDIHRVALEDDWAKRKLCLAMRSREHLPAAALRLVEHLQSCSAEEAAIFGSNNEEPHS